MALLRPACFLLCVVTFFAAAQQKKDSAPNMFKNPRLKKVLYEDHGIDGDKNFRVFSGIWLSESKDPEKDPIFPEQSSFTCTHQDMTCQELRVTLGVVGPMISLQDAQETDWTISSWDDQGLLASNGPDASDRCHHHILTMNFASGIMSVSDIPTRVKGCEMFTETNTYRLKRGNYYIDTSPDNDLDKKKK